MNRPAPAVPDPESADGEFDVPDYQPDDEWAYLADGVAHPFERGDYVDGRR